MSRVLNDNPYLMVLSSRGMINEGWYDDAVEQCKAVLTLPAATDQHRKDATCLIANAYFLKKDLMKAIEWFRKHEAMETEPTRIASTKCSIGNCFYELGDKNRAKKMYEAADAIRRKVPKVQYDSATHSQILYALAQIARDEADFEVAEKKCREVVKMREKEEEGPRTLGGLSSALDLLGTILIARVKYAEAVETFERALKISREMRITQVERRVLGHMASALWFVGREDEAIKRLREHLKLCRELYGPHAANVVMAMHDLARYLIAKNEKVKEADKLLKDAYRMSQNLTLHNIQDVAFLNMMYGIRLFEKGKFKDAEKKLNRFESIIPKVKHFSLSPDIIPGLRCLGYVAERKGYMNVALKYAKHVLVIEDKINTGGITDVDTKTSVDEVVHCYKCLGKYKALKDFLCKRLKIEQSRPRRTSELRDKAVSAIELRIAFMEKHVKNFKPISRRKKFPKIGLRRSTSTEKMAKISKLDSKVCDSTSSRICSACGRQDARHQCPCHIVRYCNRQCQKSHWKSSHKDEHMRHMAMLKKGGGDDADNKNRTS